MAQGLGAAYRLDFLPPLGGAARRYLPSRLPPLLAGAVLKRYLSPRLPPAFGWRSAALLTVSTPPLLGGAAL